MLDGLKKRMIILSITAVLLGFIIVLQIRSLQNVDELFFRDNVSNIFQEINILKEKNSALADEIEDLEKNLEQFDDQNLALDAIESEINKYKKLSGDFSVFGPGITVTLTGEFSTPWMIDLINHFFNSGAQAVDVNGIRITNQSAGFDTLPQGQIFLNGSILSEPYIFNVLGESSTLIDILELPGGVFDRLQATFPDLIIETVMKDVISIN